MFRAGLLFALALLAAPAGAEIFKWTDSQGKVHYGDQPPSSTTPNTFDPGTSAAAEARALELRREAATEAARKRLEQTRAREESSQQRAAEWEESQRKAKNCQRARGNLELLQRAHMRLRTVGDAGQSGVLDEAARQVAIERANQTIAENCTD